MKTIVFAVVMNACLSGTPIVGIGMHPEQHANLDACVRKGFAIRLNKRRVTASDVLAGYRRAAARRDRQEAGGEVPETARRMGWT